MAKIDPELRAAIHAFFRAWRGEQGSATDAGFTEFVDKTIVENQGHLQEAFLMFHAALGRYPTFEELMSRAWKFSERPAGEQHGRNRS
jgi:hypothetical protein